MEKLGIKRIMTHCEKAAAYMADAYARVSGRAGVCMAQSVGAANLAAGLQDAFLSCSPVIAMTGRRAQINQRRHAYQEVDHGGPFAAVTKYSVLVNSAEQLPFSLRQAFREATSGTPGPVHLDLEGVNGHVVVGRRGRSGRDRGGAVYPGSPLPTRAGAVSCARSDPVALPGRTTDHRGRRRCDCLAGRAELVALAEKLSIPVATSLNAKAHVPVRPPACRWASAASTRGRAPTRRSARPTSSFSSAVTPAGR